MKRSTYTLRRLLALVLVLIMVGSLFAGCNQKEPDPTDPSEPSETAMQPTDPTDAPTDPTEEPTEPTEPTVTVPPVTMGTVNADNLNVRSEPYSTADILKRLAINTRIEIEEQKIVDGVNWGRIAEGWINLNYVTIDGEGTTGTDTVIDNDSNIDNGNVNTDVNKTYNGVITASELYIREDADADSKSVGTYKKGDKVVIIGQRDGWGKTDKGWINMDYVDLNGSSSNTGSSTGSSSSGTNSTTVSNGNKVALGTGTVVGTSSLAIRTGPGTNYTQVGFIRLGDTENYYQKSGNWVRLSKGWANSNYLELEYAIASGTEGTINTAELNVREEADEKSTSLTTVKKGDEVTILEVKGIWGKIEYETGKFGWINLDYVKFTTASSTYAIGEYVVTADALHYRKEANADSTALGTYKKNDKVTVTEIAGNWGKTDKGWINLKYTEATSVYTTGTGTVTASTLNIRDKASTSGKDIGSYKKGDKVTITEVSGSWGKTDKGWISLKYVEMDPAVKYSVAIGTITGGTVKTSSTSYVKGATVTLTITPDSGKELDTLTVKDASGNAVTVKDNKFTMPASKVTITATFKDQTAKYTVTIKSATNGKVTASTTSCAAGTVVTLTAAPNSGYVLDTLSVVNTSDNSTVFVNGGKFTMPAGDVNVVATFKAAATTYKVTVNTAANGSVSANTTVAEAGDTITLTVAPAEGYELDAVTVKDSSNATVSVSNNTFTMPAKDVTVAATFKVAKYAVEITTPENGSVSVNPDTFAKGETVTLTITPATGYELDTLKVNGSAITGNKFTMPGSKATVVATFKKIQYTVTVGAVTNGTVTADKAAAGIGDTVKLTVTAKDGYELDTLTVKNGDTAISVNATDNTFTMPAGNVTVTATFKEKVVTPTVTYKITVTAKDKDGNNVSGIAFAIKDQANNMEALTDTLTTGADGTVTFTSFKKEITQGMKLVADCNADLYDTQNKNPVRTATVTNGNLTPTPNSSTEKHEYLLVNAAGSFVAAFTVYVKSST